jgi:hypothetical protein
MARLSLFLIAAAALLTAVGCAKRPVMEVPPRMDLHAYDVVGVVQFDSEAEGNLAAFATQRFIQTLQESQPGVRVLELGNATELKRTIGSDALDIAAIRKIGEQYGVDAVIIGTLAVTNVRPQVNLSTMLSSVSASAKVDAALTTRLYETGRGATLWTKSTQGTKTVAHAGLGSGGSFRFDAQDPEKAYGALVDALIVDVTRDFRVTYVRQ